jgi:hypothetical protein
LISQSRGLGDVYKRQAANPGLLSKILNPGKEQSSQFVTAQELNIERQREELQKKEKESKQQIQQQQNMINQLQNQLKLQQVQNLEPQPANAKPPVTLPQTIPANQLRTQTPDVRAPNQVKDILSRIHSLQPTSIKPGATETQDESSSNNDRIVSETNFSESNTKKKAGRKPKQGGISIF